MFECKKREKVHKRDQWKGVCEINNFKMCSLLFFEAIDELMLGY